MRNILVTGGAGFIGSNFVRHLLKTEPDVFIYNLDLLTYAGNLDNLKDLPDTARHKLIHGDICDRALVEWLLRQHQIGEVIHFAAETHVDRSISGPDRFIQTNLVGTFTLLEAARQVWLVEKIPVAGRVHFHHVSSDEVYGTLRPGDPPFAETTPYAPNSPYSASKAGSDHLVRAYDHTYGLPVTLTSCSNNYGPYQFPEKLIPLIILNALDGRTLPVYGDGQQIRDWLFVEDHCEAIWLVANRGRLGETYNIGGGNQPTNLEIVHRICSILDRSRPAKRPYEDLIQHISDRPGHDRRYAMNIAKVQAELGWQPRYSLQRGLELTVDWYCTHAERVRAARSNPDYANWLTQNYTAREVTQ